MPTFMSKSWMVLGLTKTMSDILVASVRLSKYPYINS